MEFELLPILKFLSQKKIYKIVTIVNSKKQKKYSKPILILEILHLLSKTIPPKILQRIEKNNFSFL